MIKKLIRQADLLGIAILTLNKKKNLQIWSFHGYSEGTVVRTCEVIVQEPAVILRICVLERARENPLAVWVF